MISARAPQRANARCNEPMFLAPYSTSPTVSTAESHVVVVELDQASVSRALQRSVGFTHEEPTVGESVEDLNKLIDREFERSKDVRQRRSSVLPSVAAAGPPYSFWEFSPQTMRGTR